MLRKEYIWYFYICNISLSCFSCFIGSLSVDKFFILWNKTFIDFTYKVYLLPVYILNCFICKAFNFCFYNILTKDGKINWLLEFWKTNASPQNSATNISSPQKNWLRSQEKSDGSLWYPYYSRKGRDSPSFEWGSHSLIADLTASTLPSPRITSSTLPFALTNSLYCLKGYHGCKSPIHPSSGSSSPWRCPSSGLFLRFLFIEFGTWSVYPPMIWSPVIHSHGPLTWRGDHLGDSSRLMLSDHAIYQGTSRKFLGSLFFLFPEVDFQCWWTIFVN